MVEPVVDCGGMGARVRIAMNPSVAGGNHAAVHLFRDEPIARETFSLVPAYLRTGGDAAEPVWFSENGLEQTRPFRALKVWMQLAHLGRHGYRRLMARDIAVAGGLRRQLDASDDFEVLAHGLSVVCFRHRPAGMAEGDLDLHNRSLLRGLQARGGAFVAGTQVGTRFALRACIVNPLTTLKDVTAIVAEARYCASLVPAEDGSGPA
jgi:aromatic-L-amino-acid decarboxylase